MIDTTGSVGIDPLPEVSDGIYRDTVVEVARSESRGRRSIGMVRTEHFDVIRHEARVSLTHCVPPERIDNDLAGLLADELFTPGWLRGPGLFERLFTGIVLTCGPDPLAAWTRFYQQSLAGIEACLGAEDPDSAHGTIADYAPVYATAERALAPGEVLEIGACFGFFSLRLASGGRRVTAVDLSSGSVRLLAAVAPRLGLGLSAQVADGARVPRPDASVENVVVLHLLEHLEPEHGRQVVAEAIRLARRRVVIAVPLETEADQTWGHVRTVSLTDLRHWGEGTGLRHQVFEDHGGWLVLDVDNSAGDSTGRTRSTN